MSDGENTGLAGLGGGEAAEEEHRGCLWYFMPGFDELSLFLMSVAFLALFFTDGQLRHEWSTHLFTGYRVWALLGLLVVFVTGMVYSICHVFTTREKTEPEKWVMLFFGVVVSYASGVAAGVHILRESQGWLIVFPIWNVIAGVMLMLLSDVGKVDDTYVSDEDAGIREVIVGLFLLCVLLVLCQYVWRLYWAVTFSICVGYATTLSKLMRHLTQTPLALRRRGRQI